MRARDDALDQRRIDARDRIEQSHVRGHVDHAQFRRHEHHRHFGRVGERGQQLGVTRIFVPGRVQRLLAERRGADRLRAARLDDAHRTFDVAVGGFARDRGGLAERQVRGNSCRGRCTPHCRGDTQPRPDRRGFRLSSWLPTSSPARRSRSPSPITSGLHIARTSADASAFMMISGPMPAASPIVIAIVGRIPPVRLMPVFPSVESKRSRSSARIETLCIAEGARLGDDRHRHCRAPCKAERDSRPRFRPPAGSGRRQDCRSSAAAVSPPVAMSPLMRDNAGARQVASARTSDRADRQVGHLRRAAFRPARRCPRSSAARMSSAMLVRVCGVFTRAASAAVNDTWRTPTAPPPAPAPRRARRCASEPTTISAPCRDGATASGRPIARRQTARQRVGEPGGADEKFRRCRAREPHAAMRSRSSSVSASQIRIVPRQRRSPAAAASAAARRRAPRRRPRAPARAVV